MDDEIKNKVEDRWAKGMSEGMYGLSLRVSALACMCRKMESREGNDWGDIVERMASEVCECRKEIERVYKELGVKYESIEVGRVMDSNEELYMNIQGMIVKVYGEIKIRKYAEVRRVPSSFYMRVLREYLDEINLLAECLILKTGDRLGCRMREEVLYRLERESG